MIKTMDAVALKKALEKNEVVVIDVREPDEYAEAHIEGTVLMPLGTLAFEAMPEQSGRKLVLHCRSGKRSAYACEQLIADNPELEIYNLEGGILAWIALGYAVKTH
ncbi:MAG: rhodanese-like domain-containing protein [Legionella sp.]|nr:rhodanese-like domain-containing protein [Legionella sp.]